MKTVFMAKLLEVEIDVPSILSRVNLNVPARILRNSNFLWLDYHRTDYGQNEPIRARYMLLNENYHLFHFNLSTSTFKNILNHDDLI